jgi:predicted O-linked N-acetylglucosamine transferase (SPINDLY family)
MTQSFQSRLSQAHAWRQRGQFAEAERLYEDLLQAEPKNFDAMHALALVAFQTGRMERGVALVRKALELNPLSVDAHLDLGRGLKELGRFGEALASYDKAIAIKPDYAEAYSNRGSALFSLQRIDDALADCDKAIALKPNFAPAHNNRAIALSARKAFRDALAAWDRAIALSPGFADAHANKGAALVEMGQYDQALAALGQAIALNPGHVSALNSRGVALKELSRLKEAIADYDRAISLAPGYWLALYNRGNAFRELGETAEARRCYERALALKPDYAEAKIALCVAQLPIIYADEAEIDERRSAYRKHLQALSQESQAKPSPDLAAAVGSAQPFFLAYQGRDDRDLQEIYGAFACRAMASQYPAAIPTRSAREAGPLRVGFASGFFRQHSNWKIPIKGWLGQLNRRRFKVFGYHTSPRQDAATQEAAALCDRFVQGPLSIGQWRQAILDDAPDVLIYPEVGMDPVCGQLAALRLAPVQCSSWGHPQTSGMPTLDYYLSSDLMEPPEAQSHYSERLIRLPNLSVYYEPVAVEPAPVSRAALGLRPNACVFFSGQSLYKYLPQFDAVFAKIADAAGDCQFVFLRHPTSPKVTESFRARLAREFAAAGRRSEDHCVFLDRLNPREFAAAMQLCDVFLDSIGWSGCNSTLESLAYGLPIVTLPGPLMRSRHSAAILRMIGATETIAESVQGYVEIAAGLARDRDRRLSLSRAIAEGKHRAYKDVAPILALEDFLEQAA